MHGIIQRRWEQSGSDQQERLKLSFNTMFPREKDNALRSLFDFWREKQALSGKTPRVEDFIYQDNLPESVTRYVCWIDATAENPFNFVTRDHPHLTAFTTLSDHRIGEHPCLMNVRAVVGEYLHCINTRQPTYFEIDQSFGSIDRHYVRLLLPVAENSDRVTRLVYAVRIVAGSVWPGGGANSCDI